MMTAASINEPLTAKASEFKKSVGLAGCIGCIQPSAGPGARMGRLLSRSAAGCRMGSIMLTSCKAVQSAMAGMCLAARGRWVFFSTFFWWWCFQARARINCSSIRGAGGDWLGEIVPAYECGGAQPPVPSACDHARRC